jgi:hypothetical protein
MVLVCNSNDSSDRVLAMKDLRVNLASSKRIEGLLPEAQTIDPKVLAQSRSIVDDLVIASERN